jgi:hypothetical protein
MFLEITNAKYLNEFRISLEFNNGESKTVDLKDELEGEVFQPLKDIEYFKDFSVKYNTIEWKNGADFAPEYLFAIGK